MNKGNVHKLLSHPHHIFKWIQPYCTPKYKYLLIFITFALLGYFFLYTEVFSGNIKDAMRLFENSTTLTQIGFNPSSGSSSQCTNTSCFIIQQGLQSKPNRSYPNLENVLHKAFHFLAALKNNSNSKMSAKQTVSKVKSALRHYETSFKNSLKKILISKFLKGNMFNEEEQGGLARSKAIPLCPTWPPSVQGRKDIHPSVIPPTIKVTEMQNSLVSDGGHYSPPGCQSRWKVAVIIPFRNRTRNLHYFLYFMHPILQRQQLDYKIYVINQFGSGKFNRAKLLNVGYAESIKDYDFQCFVFHDVDLILENDHALYSCPLKPRHLASAVNKYKYRVLYDSIFGGACEFTKQQFIKVNGFSNEFWGWGGEDDDMYKRIRSAGMRIIRYPTKISRYFMLDHAEDIGNEQDPLLERKLITSWINMKNDGLNNLRYKVLAREDYPLYTKVTVDIFASQLFNA